MSNLANGNPAADFGRRDLGRVTRRPERSNATVIAVRRRWTRRESTGVATRFNGNARRFNGNATRVTVSVARPAGRRSKSTASVVRPTLSVVWPAPSALSPCERGSVPGWPDRYAHIQIDGPICRDSRTAFPANRTRSAPTNPVRTRVPGVRIGLPGSYRELSAGYPVKRGMTPAGPSVSYRCSIDPRQWTRDADRQHRRCTQPPAVPQDTGPVVAHDRTPRRLRRHRRRPREPLQ